MLIAHKPTRAASQVSNGSTVEYAGRHWEISGRATIPTTGKLLIKLTGPRTEWVSGSTRVRPLGV